MFLRRVSIILIVIFWVFPQISFAQAIDSFSISASPESPKEFQQTTISLDSFSTDLVRSKITWKENGIVVAQENGLTEKNFTAPRNGSTKTLEVEVLTPNGLKIKKSYTLAPQAIDLLWEAPDSYVPPFYKGKALAGEQSVVRIVAIPNFTKNGIFVDRSQTTYTWSQGGRQPEGASGYNKSSFSFKFNPLKSGEAIKVLAGTLDGVSQIQESLILKPTQTEINIYQASPLLGTLREKAFKNTLLLSSSEVTLVAEPFYFSGSSSIQNSLNFYWTIGGINVNPGTDSTRITLRSPGKAGRVELGIVVKNVGKTLQNISVKLPIIYDK